jgi:site-specific recombinase XerD
MVRNIPTETLVQLRSRLATLPGRSPERKLLMGQTAELFGVSVATLLKHQGIRTLSAHSLRHTAGTLGLRAGADLRKVQDLLGHSNPSTTAIYAHVNDRWAANPAAKIGVSV